MGSIVRSAFVLSVLPLLTTGAWASGHPQRPVTVVVPAAPGGVGDTTTRLLVRSPECAFGRGVTIVDEGQGGVVGPITRVEAVPDGCTVGLLFPHAGYEYTEQATFARADFVPKRVPGVEGVPLAGPAGGSPEVAKAWETAVHQTVESRDFHAATAEADFGVEWMSADERSAPMFHYETEAARVMGALGDRK